MRPEARLAGAGVLACLLMTGGSGPASATQTLVCGYTDDVTVNLLMGSLEVAAIVRANITAAGQRWSTQESQGSTQIVVGQAFQTGSELRVDFTDREVNRVLARLRLFQATDDANFAQAGTLKVEDVGVWPVVCSEGG